jgi:hypothetical protein
MKPLTICLVFSLLFLQSVKSQDSLKNTGVRENHPIYLIKLFLSGDLSISTHMMDIKDSSIYVYSKKGGRHDPFHTVNMNNPSDWDSYNYKFVTGVKMRNKSLRSWVIPTSIIVGALLGGLIGNSINTGDDLNGEVNHVGSVFLGAVLGAGVGTIAGFGICSASEKKYMINGEWKSLEEMKADLKY